MEVSDFLAQDDVVPCAKVTSKRQLLQMLADKASEKCGFDSQKIFEVLMAREQLGSTGLGNGIAIPHGKLKGLDKVIALFARADSPIEFDSVDDQPVDLAFMLLAPEGSGADHLKALSRVARLLRTETVVDAIRHTKDKTEIYGLLSSTVEGSAAA